ncbi:MAG: cobalamin-dependent protein [Bryobacterales bacterium]|nr:cobalamin-dependent protein [Bryobacterales bacterium]
MAHPIHPKGSQARILLSSVFGPYAQDDEYGSRSINPMELYHNQVTRLQGPFSLRLFHRSWGIMFIQTNIKAPCAVLDFPTRERFAEEISTGQYDVIGISSIIVNVGKVKEMCQMVRKLSPQSTILVGGHVAAIPELDKMIDADHIVQGEGVGWMRRYLGEDDTAPIKHPVIAAGFGHRVMGIKMPTKLGSTAATIIPSVGCPMGCEFCTTSSFYGGKGRYQNFLNTGAELFAAMEKAESSLGMTSFFLMDENFLLHRRRALELLELMKAGHKAWTLYVFSSANAVRQYSIQELVELGVAWIWMGLESPRSGYEKLSGADTLALTRELRTHGIAVLGSTIIGMEHHTPENIHAEIDHAIAHDSDFHQFMLFTPVPGTPLYRRMNDTNRLIDVDLADIHGQYQFNWKHPHITPEQSKHFLDMAFARDFEVNGPSLARFVRTTLAGWKRYKDFPDLRVRARFEKDREALRTYYSGLLWAAEKYVARSNEAVAARLRELRAEVRRECGASSKWMGRLIGPALLWAAKREQKRLERGITYEPPTFFERSNWQEA